MLITTKESNLSINQLIGQKNLKKRLQDSLKTGSLAQHAFLFVGDQGMGKQSFAFNFAQIILCQANNNNNFNRDKPTIACRQCDSCRYFAAGTHPDFKILNRNKERMIRVDRIRQEVVADIHVRPQLSENKIYFINMDDLNEQGQNALLKSLEEPPKFAIFVLTATLQDNLLKTILSRVAIFNFQRYTNSEIKEILLLNDVKDDLDFIVQYAAGNPGRALQIASDDAFKQIRQEANDWFFQIPTASRTDLLVEGINYLKNSKDQINLILDLWQDLIRDILVLMEDKDSEQLKHTDLKKRLTRLAQAYIDDEKVTSKIRKNRLLNSFSLITEVRRASRVNASFDGMTGQLLLAMRKDFYINGRSS